MQTQFKAICLAAAMTLCAGCGNNRPEAASGYSEYEKPDTVNAIQKMKDYHYSAEITVGGVPYAYDIVREVNDTLPTVTGDDGGRYADNYIRLRVNRQGQQIFNKVFLKQHFKDFIDAGFLSKAVLEGMAFDRVEGDRLRFAASICYPGTDIYIPMSITIAPDGSFQMAKDEILDTVVEVDSLENEE